MASKEVCSGWFCEGGCNLVVRGGSVKEKITTVILGDFGTSCFHMVEYMLFSHG